MTNPVHSVVKAMSILEAFDDRHKILTVREISSLTGIPRSTCHALCATLTAAGALEVRDNDGYQLGSVLAKLGGHVIERTGLVDAALGPASTILASTQTEIHVAQYVETGIVYLLRIRNARRMPSHNRTGRFWPLHTSACGVAVFAALAADEAEEHLHGLSDDAKQALAAATDMLGKRGYVVFDGSEVGYRSIAAPIRNRHGRVVGAVGTGDCREIMTQRRIQEIGIRLRRTAEEASSNLGYFPLLRSGGVA